MPPGALRGEDLLLDTTLPKHVRPSKKPRKGKIAYQCVLTMTEIKAAA